MLHHKTTTPQYDHAAAPSECCTSACRSKARQILGVDLQRWTLLGIIVILLILLISLVARLRGAQPRALPQMQVQGGLFSLFTLAFGAAPSYAAVSGATAQVASTATCAVLPALAGMSAHQRCHAGRAPR